MKRKLLPEDWGLEKANNGGLSLNGTSLAELAYKFGTPLHILNEQRLFNSAKGFSHYVESYYQGKYSIHYPFKCNSLAYLLKIIKSAGLKAEVATDFEYYLAKKVGFTATEIIVNGPYKSQDLLVQSITDGVKFIVVDSIDELSRINEISQKLNKKIDILIRVNPDYVPSGMNKGSATGSRKGSVFGFDYKGGEISMAFKKLKHCKYLVFKGFHFHIGTGIRKPKDYSNCLYILKDLIKIADNENQEIEIIDVGGGIASMTTKEMTTKELLLYQGLSKLPNGIDDFNLYNISNFIFSITNTIMKCFHSRKLPELIFEPGRSLTSPNQILLLRICAVKERQSGVKWLIADGGISTVCLPVYYEYHEVFLCNDLERKPSEKVTIVGPACFAGDVIYKNKIMPKIAPGEVIAIMDSGAYFLPLESSFGFPHSSVVAVNGSNAKLIRRRESFEEMLSRDEMN